MSELKKAKLTTLMTGIPCIQQKIHICPKCNTVLKGDWNNINKKTAYCEKCKEEYSTKD